MTDRNERDLEFAQPNFNSEAQATSFILDTLNSQESTKKINYKKSPLYFILNLDSFKRNKNNEIFLQNQGKLKN